MTTDDRENPITTAPAPEHTGPDAYTGPDPARVHFPAPDHVTPDALQESPRSWAKSPWAIIAVAGGVLFSIIVALLVVTGAKSAPVFTLNGTLTVTQSTLQSGGLPLSEAFPDIADGDQVMVVNSSDAVVGFGTLNQQAVPKGQLAIDTIDGAQSEYFTFTVANLPPGLARYGIRVGDKDRGIVWETPAAMHHEVDLTLS